MAGIYLPCQLHVLAMAWHWTLPQCIVKPGQCSGDWPDVSVPPRGSSGFEFSSFEWGVVIWRGIFSPSSAGGCSRSLVDGGAQEVSHPPFHLSLSPVAGCSLWWLPGLLTWGSPLNISVSKADSMVLFHTDAGFTQPLLWHFPCEFCALHHYGDDWVCQGREEKCPLGSLLRGPLGYVIKIPFDIGFSSPFWGAALGWGKGAQLLAFLGKHLEYFSANPCWHFLHFTLTAWISFYEEAWLQSRQQVFFLFSFFFFFGCHLPCTLEWLGSACQSWRAWRSWLLLWYTGHQLSLTQTVPLNTLQSFPAEQSLWQKMQLVFYSLFVIISFKPAPCICWTGTFSFMLICLRKLLCLLRKIWSLVCVYKGAHFLTLLIWLGERKPLYLHQFSLC